MAISCIGKDQRRDSESSYEQENTEPYEILFGVYGGEVQGFPPFSSNMGYLR
jgi:hypothetical protein